MLDEELRASAQDGTYPRPQLVRPRWLDLSGEWDFAYDDDVTVDGTSRHPRRIPPHDRRALPARVPALGHQRHRVPPRRLVPPPRRRGRARARRPRGGPHAAAALRRRRLPRGRVDRRRPRGVARGRPHAVHGRGARLRGGLRHRRAGRGRPPRPQPAARQAGLAARAALHLVPPHDGHLAAGLAGVGAAAARDARGLAPRHPERSRPPDPRARRAAHRAHPRARHAPPR